MTRIRQRENRGREKRPDEYRERERQTENRGREKGAEAKSWATEKQIWKINFLIITIRNYFLL